MLRRPQGARDARNPVDRAALMRPQCGIMHAMLGRRPHKLFTIKTRAASTIVVEVRVLWCRCGPNYQTPRLRTYGHPGVRTLIS